MKNILIIGCGYVGKAIAQKLFSDGFSVTNIVKGNESRESLIKEGFAVQALENISSDNFNQLIQSHEILIVTVAAPSPQEYENTYLNTARKLKSALSQTPPVAKQIIYTSSTSVYSENSGNVVTEEDSLNWTSPNSRVLIETEKKYASLGVPYCIFRLSEIYGPGRALKEKISLRNSKPFPGDGTNPTNMIHLNDIVGAISFAVYNRLQGIYNLTDDEHTPRKELYQSICIKYQLKSVSWDSTLPLTHSSNKIVSNEKIKKAGYKLLHPRREF